jgi:hypothetical protein
MGMPLQKATEATVSVTTSSIAVLSADARRKYALISNGGAAGLWLSHGGTAVVGTGVYVPAGASYEIDADNLWTGAVAGIAASGTLTVGVLELK